MWVGGVANSQTRSKHLKTPPNHPENRLFRPEFHLSISQISQKPWGGWVGKQIWERSPKKKTVFFFGSFPKCNSCLVASAVSLTTVCLNYFVSLPHPFFRTPHSMLAINSKSSLSSVRIQSWHQPSVRSLMRSFLCPVCPYSFLPLQACCS